MENHILSWEIYLDWAIFNSEHLSLNVSITPILVNHPVIIPMKRSHEVPIDSYHIPEKSHWNHRIPWYYPIEIPETSDSNQWDHLKISKTRDIPMKFAKVISFFLPVTLTSNHCSTSEWPRMLLGCIGARGLGPNGCPRHLFRCQDDGKLSKWLNELSLSVYI